MVAFIGRHRAVEGRQIGRRFGMHRTNAQRRLCGLVRKGLLEHRRVLHRRPGVYLATRAGLDFVGLELPPARVDLRSYEHDVEIVWLSLVLEREFGADAVLTERELRSRDMSAAWTAHNGGARVRPRYAVATGSGRAPRGLHFPDLAVEKGAPRGGLLAIELERTSKGAARRREIVAAYQNGIHVDQVRYYGTPDSLRAIERTVAEHRSPPGCAAGGEVAAARASYRRRRARTLRRWAHSAAPTERATERVRSARAAGSRRALPQDGGESTTPTAGG
jgi:hypothetical protein